MYKSSLDPKVKKTLVRNCEKKLKTAAKKPVVYDTGSTSRARTNKTSDILVKENKLDMPTLCSSETLAQYLSDARISSPPPLTIDDLNIVKGRINTKVTKKLNFHFNDRIYKNLIVLNTNVEDSKKKKDKRPSSGSSSKRDLEPSIEDFYEDVTESDSPPHIPIIKPKFKVVKTVENKQLHKLVATFECL